MRCAGHHRPLKKEEIMDTARNKDLARRLYALINQGRVDQLAGLVSPGYEEHDPLPGQGSGREGAIDRFSMITTALAPHFTVEDLIAEGDRVVVRWTNAGTHVGEFAGIPATGRTFTIAGIDIYRVADGRLCEHWHVIDQLGMLGQLGLLPHAAAA
jgi:steroid delta-isomerase-like uncharacterized protein